MNETYCGSISLYMRGQIFLKVVFVCVFGRIHRSGCVCVERCMYLHVSTLIAEYEFLCPEWVSVYIYS